MANDPRDANGLSFHYDINPTVYINYVTPNKGPLLSAGARALPLLDPEDKIYIGKLLFFVGLGMTEHGLTIDRKPNGDVGNSLIHLSWLCRNRSTWPP